MKKPYLKIYRASDGSVATEVFAPNDSINGDAHLFYKTAKGAATKYASASCWYWYDNLPHPIGCLPDITARQVKMRRRVAKLLTAQGMK